MPADREDYLVEQTLALLKHYLPLYAADKGLDPALLPDLIHGYTDDVLIPARDDANSIRVWCDSTKTVEFYATLGFKTEEYPIGILYTYTGDKAEFGTRKRITGEMIRAAIGENWPPYYGGQTLSVQLTSDYRYTAHRMQGGSSKSLVGKFVDVGNNKEGFMIGVLIRRRVYDNLNFSC